MKQEQMTKRKQKRREPTTEELQADFLEQREHEAAERIRRKLGTATEFLERTEEIDE